MMSKYVVLEPLRHNGQRYGVGARINLKPADAQRLREAGVVELVAAEQVQQPAAVPVQEPPQDAVGGQQDLVEAL